MHILDTDRLTLCELSSGDAEFIFTLLNDPSWLRYIGDKGVRNLEDARRYILNGPVYSYSRFGYGLYLTKLKTDQTPIGLCGLLKRESLDDPDIGFAFLTEHTGKGYAYESAAAVMQYAKDELGLERVVAITSVENHSSIRLLEKLGLKYQGMINVSDEYPESKFFVPID